MNVMLSKLGYRWTRYAACGVVMGCVALLVASSAHGAIGLSMNSGGLMEARIHSPDLFHDVLGASIPLETTSRVASVAVPGVPGTFGTARYSYANTGNMAVLGFDITAQHNGSDPRVTALIGGAAFDFTITESVSYQISGSYIGGGSNDRFETHASLFDYSQAAWRYGESDVSVGSSAMHAMDRLPGNDNAWGSFGAPSGVLAPGTYRFNWSPLYYEQLPRTAGGYAATAELRLTSESSGTGPGSAPDNPVLPVGQQPAQPRENLPPGARQLPNEWIISSPAPPRTGQWYDPESASGFYFETTTDSLFTLAGLPVGFDSPLEVWLGTTKLGSFAPGSEVDFSSLPGGGTKGFSILGIDPAVDGADPLAFPIWLEFDGSAAFTMTPLATGSQVVPEPSSFLLWLLGPAAAILCARRRDRSSPQDLGICSEMRG